MSILNCVDANGLNRCFSEYSDNGASFREKFGKGLTFWLIFLKIVQSLGRVRGIWRVFYAFFRGEEGLFFARGLLFTPLFLLTFFFGLFSSAYAGVLSLMGDFWGNMKNSEVLYYESAKLENSQNIDILEAAWNRDPTLPRGGGEVIILDDNALLADTSPSRGKDVVERPENDQITVYVVREGDTLSEIAGMFGVSTNTIRWANDIPSKGDIAPGQKLVILPVSGVRYTVKKDDTLAKLAAKYKGNEEEIFEFNDLTSRALAVGDTILIPNGTIPAIVPVTTAKQPPKSGSRATTGTVSADGYFVRPVVGAIRTQGIHGYNGIDLSAPTGTAVLAAAAGEVVVSKGGWNGGYGNYIVIKHSNGTQTLYAHLSERLVAAGTQAAQGEKIAHSGNTGRSTGPHLHFEVRGAKNPF